MTSKKQQKQNQLKKRKNPFYSCYNEGNLEVWLGPVGEFESEFVLKIDPFYVKDLVEILNDK